MMGHMRSIGTALGILLALAATGSTVQAEETYDLQRRVAVMRLANDGMRIVAAQALYAGRHGGPARSVEDLVAEGAMPRPPQGSPLARDMGEGRLGWRFPEGSGTDVAEIAVWADALDGKVCRAVEDMARRDEGRFGCAQAMDGIVFRYRR